MAATWPATLPTLRLPAEYSMRQNADHLPMDIGPPETRRRSTARFIPFSHVLRFTDAQASSFKTFWEVTIKDGTLPFELALPPPFSATVELLFQLPPPTFRRNGKHHEAVARLWILP